MIAGQAETIAAQARAIEELRRKVERLERLASRNSGNSGMPPSADNLPGRTPPRGKPRRGSGKRAPGKQPGAPGSHLAWRENPDDTIGHSPQGTCGCGAALAGAVDLGVAAPHQQVEIPLASAQVIQHDLHEVACGCGCPRPGSIAPVMRAMPLAHGRRVTT